MGWTTVKRRLSEPSTWAGLSGLAVLFGANIPPEAAQAIQGLAYIFAGGAGAAAVFMPEKARGDGA